VIRTALHVLVACTILLPGCKKRRSEDHRADVDPVPVEPAPVAPTRCDRPGNQVCRGDAVVECHLDGSFGATLHACKGRCADGACVDTCAVKDVELIYVVNSDHQLLSFDPRKLPGDAFHQVGLLDCDRQSPYSMAVDRDGLAWVLYRGGNVYRVSIIDGHCNRDPAYRGSRGGTELFGMGFVSDGPKATTEKLFVASSMTPAEIAVLDVSKPSPWHTVGNLLGRETSTPELTGTADGKLFAFFPESGHDAFVQEIDRETAQPIGARMPVGSPAGEINAWAFAHWGGVFYIFVTIANNSSVYAINRKTGAHSLVLDHLPSRIVGAGVSTCAPLLERAP